MNYKTHSTLTTLLDTSQPILQISFLKYLKYEDIVKFMLVSKDAGFFCDGNKAKSRSE